MMSPLERNRNLANGSERMRDFCEKYAADKVTFDLAELTQYTSNKHPEKSEFAYAALDQAKDLLELNETAKADGAFDDGLNYALDLLATIIWMAHTHPKLLFPTYEFLQSYPSLSKVLQKVKIKAKISRISSINFNP